MTDESLSPLGVDVHYRQTISPTHKEGSFVANDTDNHDFRFAARGKRTITVAIDNPSDQTLTWSLYGMHEADGDVGDAGTFEVDVTNTILTAAKGGATNTNSYPFYLLRCSFSVEPDATTVSVYTDVMGT